MVSFQGNFLRIANRLNGPRTGCKTQNGYAIYFSRGMIPCNKKGEVKKDFDYKLHLGLQCYDSGFLKIYGNLPATPLQARRPHLISGSGGSPSRVSTLAPAMTAMTAPHDVSDAPGRLGPQEQEDLEQLKCLEHGYKIKVIMVDHAAHGVDEPEDIASIEKIIAANPAMYA